MRFRTIASGLMTAIMVVQGCKSPEDMPLVVTDNVSLLSDKTINSKVLNQTMKYNIILPNDYYTDVDSYYPVLYLFHGMGGNNNDWSKQGNAKQAVQDAIATGDVAPLIVVMPDAFNTFYVDGYQNGLQYETYFWDEFLPFIEKKYRITTERENRFIAGLSMGGFGASFYTFTHPELFIYCYAMSGALEGIGSPLTPSISDIIAQYDTFDDLPGYTIDCGTADQLVFQSNQTVHEKLKTLGFEHEYISREGTHDWVFWKEAFERALVNIGNYLKKEQ
jgi:S-formylglutathione hydrolase FrmB